MNYNEHYDNVCVKLTKTENGEPATVIRCADYIYVGKAQGDTPHGKGTKTFQNGDWQEGVFVNGKFTGTGKVKMTFPNGDYYEGDLEKDKQHGQGKYVWKNGPSYEGVFFNGNCTGQGKMTFLNKDWQEGLFVNGNFTGNGKAKITDTKGTTYIGDVKNYKPDGQGTMTFLNGNRYEGGWKDGKKHGQGTYTYKNVGYYVGGWEKDKKHGQGKMTFLNGDWREGLFEDGNFTGNGKMKKTYKDGATYIGDVKNHQPDGQGTMTFSNKDCYEGGWKEGKRHGKGKYVYKKGGYYVGDWEKDKKHGQGTMTFSNKDCYEGGWKEGKRHGKGKYVYKKGGYYVGDWEDDKRHGQGKMTSSNGNYYEGGWDDDKRHGQGKYVSKDGSYCEGEFKEDNIKQTRKIKKIPLNNTDNIFLQNMDSQTDKEYFTQQQTKQSKIFVDITKGDKLPQEDLNKKDHLKIMYSDHGVVSTEKLDNPICDLPDADRRKSYYISDVACLGAFVDEKGNNLVDKIKEKIKGKNAIGFFSNVDRKYTVVYDSSIDANGKYGSRRLPLCTKGVNVNSDDFNNSKDKYFHYYCIINEGNEQNIYKIPHQLCYWREALIDDTATSDKSKYPNKFMEALDMLKQGKPFKFTTRALVNVDGKLEEEKDKEITIFGQAEKAEVVIENGKIPEIKAIHNNENNINTEIVGNYKNKKKQLFKVCQ